MPRGCKLTKADLSLIDFAMTEKYYEVKHMLHGKRVQSAQMAALRKLNKVRKKVHACMFPDYNPLNDIS